MMDDASDHQPNIYQSNISRAGVTGKVPSAKGNTHRGVKHGKSHSKHQVRRLKKRGLISDRAASQSGL